APVLPPFTLTFTPMSASPLSLVTSPRTLCCVCPYSTAGSTSSSIPSMYRRHMLVQLCMFIDVMFVVVCLVRLLVLGVIASVSACVQQAGGLIAYQSWNSYTLF